MKKVLLWLLALTMCVSMVASFSLAGCKEEETPVEEAAPTEEEAPEEAAPAEEAPAEKVTLNIVVDVYAEDWLEALNERFIQTYPDIEPNLIIYDFMTINEKQLLELTQPNGKFNVVTSVSSWFSQYVGGGLLEPLDDYINDPNLTDAAKFDFDDFLPSMLDAYEADGKIYGFPTLSFPNVLFYREDLLTQYNIEVPKTLDEYLAAVKKLTLDTNNDGIIDIYGNVYNGAKGGVGAVGWNWFPYLFTFGGEILNDKGEPVINSPQAVKALEFYVECSKYAIPESINYTWEQALEPMQQGRAAFNITDFDAYRAYKDVTDFPIKVAPFPAGPDGKGHTLLGSWGVHIAKNSPNKTEAWKWISFIQSKEVMDLWIEFGEVPDRSSAFQNELLLENHPAMTIVYETMQTGKGLPKHKEYGKIEEAVILAIIEALAGNQTPKEALDKAQSEIEKIVQE